MCYMELHGGWIALASLGLERAGERKMNGVFYDGRPGYVCSTMLSSQCRWMNEMETRLMGPFPFPKSLHFLVLHRAHLYLLQPWQPEQPRLPLLLVCILCHNLPNSL